MAEAPAAPKGRKFRGQVFIDWNRCKGCGFCIDFCPPKILAFCAEFNSHGYHPPHLVKEEARTGCDLCGLYCPDFAIFGVRIPFSAETGEAPGTESHRGAWPQTAPEPKGVTP